MKVSGTHVVHAPRQTVWDALQDPAVLVRTIPGCQELRETGADSYAARVHAGIASITGVYDGTVALTDQDPPTSYRLRASGSGGPGTIDATATVSLDEVDDGTRVSYEADAAIGGTIAGVGQRVVAGVARRNATTFFDAVDSYLTGEGVEEAAVPAVAGAPDGGTAPTPAAAGVVHRRPDLGSTQPAPSVPIMLLAAVVGAAIALAGVLVGQRRRA